VAKFYSGKWLEFFFTVLTVVLLFFFLSLLLNTTFTFSKALNYRWDFRDILFILLGAVFSLYLYYLILKPFRAIIKKRENEFLEKGDYLKSLSVNLERTAEEFYELRKQERQERDLLTNRLKKREEELSATRRELLNIWERVTQLEKLASVGQMAGSILHEIKNPIGVVKTAVYFLKDVCRAEESEIKEQIDIIEKETERLNDIVSGIAELSRPLRQQAEEKVKIDEVLAAVIKRLKLLDLLKEIKFNTYKDGSLPKVRVAFQQFEQVFFNLITNAVYAMEGKGELSIGIEYDPDIKSVLVSFVDTGCGIAEEDLGSIFEPLFTTKEKGEGAGLGLAICLGIVRKAGGDITVSSKLGEGTKFVVKIPVMGNDD
jgi:signal transduction histidine kinase